MSNPYNRQSRNANTFAELESQNDEQMDRLHKKANVLRELTINLGDEITESNKFLFEMDETFANTEGLLASSQRKLKELNHRTGGNLWCYVTLFVLFLFFFGYYFVF